MQENASFAEKSRGQRGFTLLEVILAIGILGMIGVITINILSDQLTMRQQVTERDATRHVLDRALDRIYSDLKMAYLGNPDYGSSLNLNRRSVKPFFTYKTNNFIFFTQSFQSYVRDSNQGNMAFVRYFTQPDPINSNHNQLVRVIDTDLVSSIETKGVGHTQVLVSDLAEFKISFWNGNEYREEWDTQTTGLTASSNILPKLVKIRLVAYLPAKKDADGKNVEKRGTINLDSIVYLRNAAGQNEAKAPAWGTYKWQ